MKAKTICSYDAGAGGVAFEEGEILEVIEEDKQDSGWTFCRFENSGVEDYVPTTHIEILQEEQQLPPTKAPNPPVVAAASDKKSNTPPALPTRNIKTTTNVPPSMPPRNVQTQAPRPVPRPPQPRAPAPPPPSVWSSGAKPKSPPNATINVSHLKKKMYVSVAYSNPNVELIVGEEVLVVSEEVGNGWTLVRLGNKLVYAPSTFLDSTKPSQQKQQKQSPMISISEAEDIPMATNSASLRSDTNGKSSSLAPPPPPPRRRSNSGSGTTLIGSTISPPFPQRGKSPSITPPIPQQPIAVVVLPKSPIDTQLREFEKQTLSNLVVIEALIPLTGNIGLIHILEGGGMNDIKEAHVALINCIDESKEEQSIGKRISSLLDCYKSHNSAFENEFIMALKISSLKEEDRRTNTSCARPMSDYNIKELKMKLEAVENRPGLFLQCMKEVLPTNEKKTKELLGLIESDINQHCFEYNPQIEKVWEDVKKLSTKLSSKERSLIEQITNEQLKDPLCFGNVLLGIGDKPQNAMLIIVGEIVIINRQSSNLIAFNTNSFSLSVLHIPEPTSKYLYFALSAFEQPSNNRVVHILQVNSSNSSFIKQLHNTCKLSSTPSLEKSSISVLESKPIVGEQVTLSLTLNNSFDCPLNVENFAKDLSISIKSNSVVLPFKTSIPQNKTGCIDISFTPIASKPSVKVSILVSNQHIKGSPFDISSLDPEPIKDAPRGLIPPSQQQQQRMSTPPANVILDDISRTCCLVLPDGIRTQYTETGKLVFISSSSSTANVTHPRFNEPVFKEVVCSTSTSTEGIYVGWDTSISPITTTNAEFKPLLSLSTGAVYFQNSTTGVVTPTISKMMNQ